jgi:murein DD-endopeptidase MepM/ murein hydrolase activator NlpD
MRSSRRRNGGFGTFIFSVLLIALIAGAGFIYVSPTFEQDKPKIIIDTNQFWNLKDKLKIKINDQSGLKYYKITFIDDKNNIVLAEESMVNNTNQNQIIEVNPPKISPFYKNTLVKIKVEAIDNSKWNFLNGNGINQTFDIKIDKIKPIASVINNSRYIKRGGSAVAVVKVLDKNLKEAYITFNDKIKFKLTPFYKENYYVSLIAWPIDIEDFLIVNLVAIDKAGNKTVSKIPLYIQNAKLKKDTIKIDRKFINEVSKNVLTQSGHEIPDSLKDIFVAQNKIVRKENVDFLRKIGLTKMDYSKIDSFNIKNFRRLNGSKTVAGFGERRSYIFEGNKIDEEWHLGMDWAKVKHAKIVASNPGKVVFNSYLGIYGNVVIVDHSLGLGSLYAHLSNTDVAVGQDIYKNSKIGNSGTTGAVLGDHLHFGILVQGIEVDPIEWMDRNWIKTRITNIINQAKKEINKK